MLINAKTIAVMLRNSRSLDVETSLGLEIMVNC